jgi:hypothetical protein
MRIAKIASTIIVGAIVSIASNSAMAEAVGNGIAAPVQSGFMCPTTIEGTTPDKRAEIRALLPSGNALDNPAQLGASIDGLKRVGLSRTLIIDHLIGAYCPTVVHNISLSDPQKATQLSQFASRITALVYSEEDLSEIVLNVLLRPSIVDRVNLIAKASGLPVERWLSKTIEAAVQK